MAVGVVPAKVTSAGLAKIGTPTAVPMLPNAAAPPSVAVPVVLPAVVPVAPAPLVVPVPAVPVVVVAVPANGPSAEVEPIANVFATACWFCCARVSTVVVFCGAGAVVVLVPPLLDVVVLVAFAGPATLDDDMVELP